MTLAMTPLAFCEWLASTQWSIALHESVYMYPLVESVHVLTLTVFLGSAVMLDLRLLGLTLRNVEVEEVVGRLERLAVWGFLVMVASGAMLFYAIPVRSFQNVFFRAKMIFLILAGLNAWIFHSGIYRTVSKWNQDRVPPKRARAAGLISLVLWAFIVIAGRMIAYNWFDCEIQPQSAFVNWFAGCVIEDDR
jgi:uncharacterized protein DUF6644